MILRLFKGIMNPKTFFAPALRLQDPPALLRLSRISAKILEELGPVLHRPKAFLYFGKGKACAAQIVQDIRFWASNPTSVAEQAFPFLSCKDPRRAWSKLSS